MNKVIHRTSSRKRDAHRRADATPPPRLRDTGSSYNISSSTTSSSTYAPVDASQEIKEFEVETEASRRRSKPKGRFLKGPIPLHVITTAAQLPGKALALYLAVQHRRDLGGRSTVTVPAALLREFGISRDAKARALRYLEEAGLVRVKRQVGGTAQITLTTRT